jgi:hypothetical protein
MATLQLLGSDDYQLVFETMDFPSFGSPADCSIQRGRAALSMLCNTAQLA